MLSDEHAKTLLLALEGFASDPIEGRYRLVRQPQKSKEEARPTGKIPKNTKAHARDLHSREFDIARSIWELQDEDGRKSIIRLFAELPSKHRDLAGASGLVLEMLFRCCKNGVSDPEWLNWARTRINAPGQEEWALHSIRWMLHTLACARGRADRRFVDAAHEMARLALSKAHLSLPSNPNEELIRRLADPEYVDYAKLCRKTSSMVALASQQILLNWAHDEYVSGITSEINEDLDREIDILESLGVPGLHVSPLRQLDAMFRGASSAFQYAAFSGACRQAFEPLMKHLAAECQRKHVLTLKRPPGASAEDALDCLKQHGILHPKECSLLKALFDATSVLGSHTNAASRDSARILKNMVVEAVLLVAQRTRMYMNKHEEGASAGMETGAAQ